MFVYKNSVPTSLAGSVLAGATSFTVNSVAGFPVVTTASKDFTVMRLDHGGAAPEDAIVTDINTGTLVCTCLPLASPHAINAAVNTDVLSKESLNQLKDDALIGGPFNAVSGSASLAIDGSLNIVTISAAATLTIANGTYKGQACRILMAASSTALGTISCTGSGVTGKKLCAGEIAIPYWDGAAWQPDIYLPVAMIASIYRNGALSIAGDNAAHLITFETTEYDNTGLMADLANNAVLIKRTNKYDIFCPVRLAHTHALSAANLYVYQNNSTIHALDERHSLIANLAATLAARRTVSLTAADSITAKLVIVPGTGSASEPLGVATPDVNSLQLREIPAW